MKICRAHVTPKRGKMDTKSGSLGVIPREPITGTTADTLEGRVQKGIWVIVEEGSHKQKIMENRREAYAHKRLLLEEEGISFPVYCYE